MKNNMDIIISLVGFNPIPNYVSILNYCKDESKIFLIHSGQNENVSSEEVAKNIEKVTSERFKKTEINTIKSSKSNVNSITNVLNKVKEEILNIIESTKQPKIEILLDITGGTKSNSALAYSMLSSYLVNNDKVRLYQCYVSSEEERIYQSGYEDRIYLLKDLAVESKITKEEILDLHRYEEYEKSNQSIKIIKNIILKDFTLIFHIKSKYEKIGKIKGDMFIALDIAERLGGSLSRIFFEANSFKDTGNKSAFDEESGQEFFINMLENGTNKSYKDRIILRSLCDGYCNNEKMEELIEELIGGE